ncbi:MAG: molybdenum cofactor biosynthesis protein [Herpetosiphonaceae bacterium]|nr:MAG: molybdenum cofactor biosynthesis protein [Herpetosiphonaceae bacterium]
MLNSTAVGRVVALYRYPVKSMAGEMVETARVWWHGFEGDRRYAFVQAGTTSAFPWLTAREYPELLHYRPSFRDPADPARSAIDVHTPEGALLPIESNDLRLAIETRAGRRVYLLQLGRGTVDSMAVSLLSRASLESMSVEAGLALDARRFRANIVVESFAGLPYAEENWIGGLLVFGDRPDSARIQAVRKDRRCMIVNLDPDTAEQDPRVLRSIVRSREECFGIYGTVLQPGTIAIGDVIQLIKAG